jgi:hypothetical protein
MREKKKTEMRMETKKMEIIRKKTRMMMMTKKKKEILHLYLKPLKMSSRDRFCECIQYTL